jgi:hypothetical protein
MDFSVYTKEGRLAKQIHLLFFMRKQNEKKMGDFSIPSVVVRKDQAIQ